MKMLEYIITCLLLCAGALLFGRYLLEKRNRGGAVSANPADPCTGCVSMCDLRSHIQKKQGGSE